jgi:1-deoxyxylulose-5-phosphate synthase
MRYISLAGVEKPVSVVALGTNTRAFAPDAYSRAAELLDALLDGGGNCIDTAHIYGFGSSEKLLGHWLKRSGRRDEIVLITKGCHPVVDPQDVFGKPWQPRVTPEAIRMDLNESLERLDTGFVDLYLLHRDDESMPVGPIVEALNGEQERGRIRAFGVSNWRAQRIAEANAYAAAHGLHGFVISSPQFGLVRPTRMLFPGTLSASDSDLGWHAARQFPILAWSVLGAGFIARAASGREVAEDETAETYLSSTNLARVRRAVELADRKNVTPIQIALAYALQQAFPLIAIIGPTSIAHLHDGLGALKVMLDEDERAFLESNPD